MCGEETNCLVVQCIWALRRAANDGKGAHCPHRAACCSVASAQCVFAAAEQMPTDARQRLTQSRQGSKC